MDDRTQIILIAHWKKQLIFISLLLLASVNSTASSCLPRCNKVQEGLAVELDRNGSELPMKVAGGGAGLDVVGDPLWQSSRCSCYGRCMEHSKDTAAEAVAGLVARSHVLGRPQLLGELQDGEGVVLLRTARGQPWVERQQSNCGARREVYQQQVYQKRQVYQ